MINHFPVHRPVSETVLRRAIKTREDFDTWRLEGGVEEWLSNAAECLQEYVEIHSDTRIMYRNGMHNDADHIAREIELYRIHTGFVLYYQGFIQRELRYGQVDAASTPLEYIDASKGYPDALGTPFMSYVSMSIMAQSLDQTIEKQRQRLFATLQAFTFESPLVHPIRQVWPTVMSETLVFCVSRSISAFSATLAATDFGMKYQAYRAQKKERTAVVNSCNKRYKELRTGSTIE